MVTRYTIDQILSCTKDESHKENSHVEMPFGVGSFSSSSSPPPETLDLSLSKASKERDRVPRTSSEDLRKYDTNLHEPPPTKREDTGASEPHLHPYNATSTSTLARPVPVRLVQPSQTSLDRPLGFEAQVRPPQPPRSDLMYGGRYGGFAEAEMYGLMLHQYLEAQYRGLAASRGFLPLHYPILDPVSGYPHMGNRSRRRGGQVRFTGDQTRQLEDWFVRHKYITPQLRKTIARDLSLQERQVKTWFQNRRAKWRKAQAQNHGGAYTDLPPSPHSPGSPSEEDKEEEEDEEVILEDEAKEDEDRKRPVT